MSNPNKDPLCLHLREADDKARRMSRYLENAAKKARELLASDEFQIHFHWIESAIQAENDDYKHRLDRMKEWEDAYGACSHAMEILASATLEIGNATVAASELAGMCADHMTNHVTDEEAKKIRR